MLDGLSIYKTYIGPSWLGPSFASWAEFCIVGRVGMGRVLGGPSLHGPSWFWAELSCTLGHSVDNTFNTNTQPF